MSDYSFPDPATPHPITMHDGSAHPGTVFLSAVVDHPRMEVGAYTYASAHQPPRDWAAHLAPYLYDFSPERLRIGRFCQIANGVQFITSSANHRHDGISSFPFAIFGGPVEGRASMPGPGPDTVVGHDVWIGQGATILPGARIGNGVIVGSNAVVGGDVASYHVVAGNPARVIKARFGAEDRATLDRIAWWNWPIEAIVTHEAAISGGDVGALQRIADQVNK